MEPFRTSGKFRYMLETLEKVGKPAHVTERNWIFDTSRTEKWRTFSENINENHPWVKQFLQCVFNFTPKKKTRRTNQEERRSEVDDTIRILFDVLDGKIHSFFSSSKADMSIFESGRIKNAVQCLEMLEPEILTYYRASQTP